MKLTISLGNTHIKTDASGYTLLVDFFERCNQYSNTDILIDFSQVLSIDYNMAAVLGAMFQKLYVEKELTFYVKKSQMRRFPYLRHNGFLGSSGKTKKSKSHASIKLTGFRSTEDVRFLDYIENDLLSHKNLKISPKTKFDLLDAFLELFCNVQKHARIDSVFACGQYYAGSQKLNFTLVDTGVGYFLPIKEYTNSKVNTASDAILWALEGNSTKKDAPGGLGLGRIQQFCKESNSTFGIITGGASWTNKEPVPVIVREFCGTIVNMIFDCAQSTQLGLWN